VRLSRPIPSGGAGGGVVNVDVAFVGLQTGCC
jgi:hypothetical protein